LNNLCRNSQLRECSHVGLGSMFAPFGVLKAQPRLGFLVLALEKKTVMRIHADYSWYPPRVFIGQVAIPVQTVPPISVYQCQ